MKTIVPPALITFAVVCFALAQNTQAVTPAPDGGYPNGNTAEGQKALFSLTTGGFNTGVGFLSLTSDTIGQLNTAIGAGTLLANTGDQNTAAGAGALLNNTTGGSNTANGAFALFSNTTGLDNTAVGFNALFNNSTNSENTAIGAGALFSTTSNGNTGIGFAALSHDTTGGFNAALGNGAGGNVTTANNVICIGSLGGNVSNSCFIANIRGITTVNNDAIPVLIDSTGQLGTTNSSRRYKTDIKPIDKASESILALKPVSFRYKIHKDTTPQFGLIAEEVAKVNPNLVIYDSDGKPFTVRYDAVNAMLLNEFLKEHKASVNEHEKVEKLEATVAGLVATVKVQATQIQKVSARFESSKPAPQVVNNP